MHTARVQVYTLFTFLATCCTESAFSSSTFTIIVEVLFACGALKHIMQYLVHRQLTMAMCLNDNSGFSSRRDMWFVGLFITYGFKSGRFA